MNKTLTPAQQKLAEDNYGLVFSFLNDHGLNSDAVEDWHGIAAVALCNAAMTYDESRGIAFSTYAYKCMENDFFHACNKQKNELNVVVSFEDIVPNTDDRTYAELIGGSEDVDMSVFDNDVIRDTYNRLPPAEKRVVALVFGEGYSGVEAAAKLKVSSQYISKVCRKFKRIIKQIYNESN